VYCMRQTHIVALSVLKMEVVFTSETLVPTYSGHEWNRHHRTLVRERYHISFLLDEGPSNRAYVTILSRGIEMSLGR
jgi:hypothetical protein